MASASSGQVGGVLHQVWIWLTGQGYRPERHYMRGPRRAHVDVMSVQI